MRTAGIGGSGQIVALRWIDRNTLWIRGGAVLVRTAFAAVLLGLGLLVREIFGFAVSLGVFAVAAMLVVAAVGRYRPRRRSRRARSWSAFAGGAGCGGGGGGGGGE